MNFFKDKLDTPSRVTPYRVASSGTSGSHFLIETDGFLDSGGKQREKIAAHSPNAAILRTMDELSGLTSPRLTMGELLTPEPFEAQDKLKLRRP
jgi:hypothetical protein